MVVSGHCQVNIGAALIHDVRLESLLTIGPGPHLSGRVRLGDGSRRRRGEHLERRDARIRVVVGAGATVLADVMKPNAVVAGVPASVVNVRDGWLDAL